MASLLKKIYNEGKKTYDKYVPEKVKKLITPIVKPVVETVKPVAKKVDENINKGVQTVKQVGKEKEKINKVKKDQNKKKEETRKQEEEKIRQELITKQKIVDDKAAEEGDGIHDLAVKSAEATTEQVERTGEILNLAVTDPAKLYDKATDELVGGIVGFKKSLDVGWNKFQTKMALLNKNEQERKIKALEYEKKNPGAFNLYDPYGQFKNNNGQMYLKAQDESISIDTKIDNAKSEFIKLQGLFDVSKSLTIKSMQGRDEWLNDYSKNKTTLEKVGVNVITGLGEQFGNPPETIKNIGINTLSTYVGAQTGMPFLGKLLDWGLSAGDNALTYSEDVKLYENREATNKEMAMTAITGVAFGELINLGLKGVKKGAFKTVDTSMKLAEINPKQMAADFWNTKFNGLNVNSDFAFEGNTIKSMVYLDSDMKTGIDGNLEQKRFFNKVKNQEVNKTNYDVNKDPSFKLENDNFRQDSFKNSLGSNIQNIEPSASVFSKIIQSVPDDLEISNKAGTPYVGTNKLKQHFSQTRGLTVKENMIKAIEPTIAALRKDRDNANKNPVVKFLKNIVMGEEKAEAHFFTDVNQNLTYEKVGNSIVSKYNGNLRRLEADFFNRLNDTYGGKVVDHRDWIREYKNDKNLFSKVYLETDFDNTTDTNLYKMISGIREDSQTIIKLNKSWNDSVDPGVIQRYPNLFTAEGVNEKEAFKLFLGNFKGIENADLKQIKSVYDYRSIQNKFDNLLNRASEKLGIKAETANFDLIRQLEAIKRKTGKELIYNAETDKFLYGKKTDSNTFRISELIKKYNNAPTDQYTNNSFKYLSEDNFKMGRVESVFDKSKFFREYNRNLNSLGEFKNKEFFQENIFPKMLENFDISEDISVNEAAKVYKMLYDTIRETTQASHLKGATTELGEILPMFKNYDSMVKFFSDLDYFHDNEKFVESVVKGGLKKQSEYMTLGKPARSFVNDMNFNLTKNIELNNDVKIDGLYLESINGLKDKVNTAIENKIIKNNIYVTENNTVKEITAGTVDWANNTYLAWSGSGENFTNRAYSNLRAKEYMSTKIGKLSTDIDTLSMTPVDFLRGSGTALDMVANGFSQLEITEDFARTFKKASAAIMGESKLNKLSDGDISLLYSAYNSEFNKINHWNSLSEIRDNIKDFTMTFQQSSEMHRNVIDVFNTNKAIFDTLNLKYDEISPSMKKLFLINGIGESEFESVKPILKEYKKTGEIIQPQRLLDLGIEGYKEAENLLAVYDNLFYELNTLNKTGAYVKGNFTSTLQGAGAKIFRSTTQGMSTDTFNKLLYFETQEGVIKNRFLSMDGLKNTARKTPAIVPAVIALGLTNRLGNLQKQMLTGRHDSMQYLSVSLAEESARMNEVINSENPQELIKNLAKYNADTILEVLQDNYDNFSNSNLLDLVYQQVGKNTYKVLTNKGENDRGTAGINTLKGLGRLAIASIFGDKSLNFQAKAKREYDEYMFKKETGQNLPYDLSLIERIKDPDIQSRASAIYNASRAEMEEYSGIEKIRGVFEAFVVTGKFLKPESQSMFKDAFNSFFSDEKKVKEYVSNAAEYIDSESKSAYEKTIEEHYKYLLVKLFKGEISEEEYERLFRETMQSTNVVTDANFSLMNKEYVNLFNDIADYRGMNEEEKQDFKEEFMNEIYKIQGKNIKVDQENFFKALDNFIPESEQESFFNFSEERKNKPVEEKPQSGKRVIVEVVGGGAGYTDVLYSDGTVWRRTGTRGARNNNPGNIDSAPWQKQFNSSGNDKQGEHTNNYNTDARSAVFATYEDGVKAYKHLVFERDLYKNKTISSVIHTYAPPSENNTGAYIQEAMKGIPGEYRNIKMKDWPEKWRNKLMENMFRVEDSGGGYKEVQIGKVEN